MSKLRLMTYKEKVAAFGMPDEQGSYLVTIPLPYPMRLSWDLTVSVKRMRVHKAVAEDLTNVFKELLSHYGYEKIKSLGLDKFGGCFNYRATRQGKGWSSHSWGIAVDLDPDNNHLHYTNKDASFARPQYLPLISIMEKYGFASLGVLKNYDWMHFEKGILI